MSKEIKIITFFVGLAVLLWNPFTILLLYANKPSSNSIIILGFFTTASLFGCLILYFLKKVELKSWIKNTLFSISVFYILFFFLVLSNFFLGFFYKNKIETGLLFNSNTTAVYDTDEFNFTAKINSIGLRDDEIELDKKGVFRIICFGDSWTFGWGVDLDNSWPKKLEMFMHDLGYTNVEVINAGRGGQYSSNYKENVMKVIPMLKPDMVILGILQIDDLAQLYEKNYEYPLNKKNDIYSIVSKVLEAFLVYINDSFNVYIRIGKSAKAAEIINISEIWKKEVNSQMKTFNHFQWLNYFTFDAQLRKQYENGKLNPSMINYFMNFPERMAVFNNPKHPATKFAINFLDQDIKEIKDFCQQHGAEIIWSTQPLAQTTGHQVTQTPSDIFNYYFKENNKIDSIYAGLARKHNIEYIELTNHMKKLKDKEAYYFEYDWHPNILGYEEIGKHIASELINRNLIKN